MNVTPLLNGEPLTAAETRALRIVQERLYRDPRTGRNLRAAIRHLKASAGYLGATEERRAYQVEALTLRYRRQATQLATEPRSSLYLRDAVHRTAWARLQREAATGALDLQAARRRSRAYGLDRWDPDVIAMHDAAFAWREGTHPAPRTVQ